MNPSESLGTVGGHRPGAPPRPALDLSVYLVTDREQCARLGVAGTVLRAVRAGATLVQVRDPQATDAELVALTRQCLRAARQACQHAGTQHPVPVLLNDRPDLVPETGADGAHVGQSDVPVADARRLIGPGGYLGLSVHTHEELAACGQLPPDSLDYLGIGPLRATASKPDHQPSRGLAHLASLAAASPWPCVVIGGVGAGDATELRAAGLAGMAVISAICGQPDVEAATRRLVEAWRGAGASTAGSRS